VWSVSADAEESIVGKKHCERASLNARLPAIKLYEYTVNSRDQKAATPQRGKNAKRFRPKV
jgi:hypothetical protein